MALSTKQQYTFRPKRQLGLQSFFEVRTVEMDTHCVIHENEMSEHYKIFCVEEGSGVYQVDFKKIEIQDAGLFFLSPGQVLSVDMEKMKYAYQICFDKDFYCVETHGKEIACNGLLFNNVHRATMLALSKEELQTFKVIIQAMISELKAPSQAAHQAMLETQLRFFLIHALRIMEKRRPNVEEEKIDAAPSRLVADYIALVEKHFTKTHAISDYAEQLFVEAKSLAKHLQAHGYPTPKQVLYDRIMLQAKRDLRFSDKTVKEIAFDMGFEDPAYFSRLFSKQEGLSPNAYRKANT